MAGQYRITMIFVLTLRCNMVHAVRRFFCQPCNNVRWRLYAILLCCLPVLLSTDFSVAQAIDWQKVYGNIQSPAEQILSLVQSPEGHLFAGTGIGDVLHSTDYGQTWSIVSNVGSQVYSVVFYGQDRLYVGTSSDIQVSTDNGVSWEQVAHFPANDLLIFSPDTIFIAGPQSVARTFDGGENWSITLASNLFFTQSIGLTRAPNDNILAYFSGCLELSCGELYKSNDVGVSWVKIGTWPGQPALSALVDSQGAIFVGSTYGVYRSLDEGSTWERALSAGGDVNVLMRITSSVLYSGAASGVNRSLDHGATWSQLGLEEVFALILTADQHLLAGTSTGLYRSVEAVTVYTEQALSGLPFASMVLQSPYPIPATSQVQIPFSLGHTTSIELVLYNVRGAVIRSKLWPLLHPGSHELSLYVGDLASGVYFLRLTSNSSSETELIVVAK